MQIVPGQIDFLRINEARISETAVKVCDNLQ